MTATRFAVQTGLGKEHHGGISSGVPVSSPWPESGATAVRMRGPGNSPLAIASRKGTSAGEPTLWTVVKPAISVTQALEAA